MPQRSTLIISAAITMFVLVIVGGLVTRVMSQTAALPATEAPAPTAEPATPAPPADPLAGVQSQIDQREAAYQSRITESNDRLQQANDQLALAYQKQQELAAQLRAAYQKQQELAAQLKRAQAAPPQTIVEQSVQPTPAKPQAAPPQPQAPAAPAYPVSADDAGAIALAAEPGTQLTAKPELVDFQGTVAYEVVLDAGKVYVDANTGQILYDGVAANKMAQQGGGHGEHEGGEHEGEHDD
jgi:uncharacterized membrane protein YkoI